jgi:hypothetical protein
MSAAAQENVAVSREQRCEAHYFSWANPATYELFCRSFPTFEKRYRFDNRKEVR